MGSWLLLVAVGCGGGSAGPVASGDDADRSGSDVSEADRASRESAEDPAVAACRDGTCTACGEGICPSGFYCDESASDGPSCGWLPECAQEPSCECLKTALGADCECSERDGGVFVSCG